jgi:hypothetical protein
MALEERWKECGAAAPVFLAQLGVGQDRGRARTEEEGRDGW